MSCLIGPHGVFVSYALSIYQSKDARVPSMCLRVRLVCLHEFIRRNWYQFQWAWQWQSLEACGWKGHSMLGHWGMNLSWIGLWCLWKRCCWFYSSSFTNAATQQLFFEPHPLRLWSKGWPGDLGVGPGCSVTWECLCSDTIQKPALCGTYTGTFLAIKNWRMGVTGLRIVVKVSYFHQKE